MRMIITTPQGEVIKWDERSQTFTGESIIADLLNLRILGMSPWDGDPYLTAIQYAENMGCTVDAERDPVPPGRVY
jgi:hypothetical protein